MLQSLSCSFVSRVGLLEMAKYILSLSLSVMLLKVVLMKVYISFQILMSMEFVFGEASQVFLWALPEVESWGAAQALHYVQPIFSLPPHLCGNHFQFVSLLALPGLSQEDPFMIDVVATATLFSGGRGQTSVIHRRCLKKLLIKDCSVFFSLGSWEDERPFSSFLFVYMSVWRAWRVGVLLCGVQMLPVHVFESVGNWHDASPSQ